MSLSPTLEPLAWAQQTFGSAQLGDVRRPPRAVALAAGLLANPAASLPRQAASRAALKASYALLHEADVTHTALLTPHWEQTREAARQHPLVLLSGDLTILDYSHHPKTTELGPIGNGKGRGYVVHSILALLPTPRCVLGLAHQIPLVPQPKRRGETLRQSQARPRQTDVWQDAVRAIGPPPEGVRWVHVGDRGSDIYRFLAACRQEHCDFLIRAAKNRRAIDEGAEDPLVDRLVDLVRRWPGTGTRVLEVPAQHGRPARTATVRSSWGQVQLLPPRQEKGYAPMEAWVVRVWEPDPPPAIKEPIEWIVLTSVPTRREAEAWERIAWYTYRWTNEDYHQCLKTGCRVEQRNLQDQPALERLLAICAPIAIRLLQLRDMARTEPERPALEVMDPAVVQVVAHLARVPDATLTVGDACRIIARRGGYLGRTRDGPPGWKTLWLGWYEVQLLVEGMRLARHVLPP